MSFAPTSGHVGKLPQPDPTSAIGRLFTATAIMRLCDHPVRRAALALAGENFHLLPVRDKRPLIPGGVHNATTDRALIRQWFNRWPDAGVGIACGASGLVALDIDPPHGPAALEGLADAYGPLPDTLSVITPRGGTHYYFAAPAGVDLRPSVGKLGDGIDVRAGGSYVVCPPSEGYHVDDPDHDLPDRALIAAAPDWLVRLCADTETAESHISVVSAVSVSLTPDDVIRQTMPDGPGQRNLLLLNLARGLKHDAGMGNAPRDELKRIVRRWWTQAQPFITTGDFDTTWFDFLHSWERAKFPLRCDLAALAWSRCQSAKLPREAAAYDEPDLKRLVGLCVELQRMKGVAEDGEPVAWSLSCSQVSRLLWGATDPVSRRKANRWLNGLAADGVLKIVKRGKAGPPGSPATRYTYAEGKR